MCDIVGFHTIIPRVHDNGKGGVSSGGEVVVGGWVGA